MPKRDGDQPIPIQWGALTPTGALPAPSGDFASIAVCLQLRSSLSLVCLGQTRPAQAEAVPSTFPYSQSALLMVAQTSNRLAPSCRGTLTEALTLRDLQQRASMLPPSLPSICFFTFYNAEDRPAIIFFECSDHLWPYRLRVALILSNLLQMGA